MTPSISMHYTNQNLHYSNLELQYAQKYISFENKKAPAQNTAQVLNVFDYLDTV